MPIKHKTGEKLREEAIKDDATEAITSKRQKPAKTLLERHRFPESGPEGQECMSQETIGNQKKKIYKKQKKTIALSLPYERS